MENKLAIEHLITNPVVLTIISVAIASVVLFLYLMFKLTHNREKRQSTNLLLAKALARLKAPVSLFFPLLILQVILPAFIPDNLAWVINRIFQPILVLAFAWVLIEFVYLGEDWLKNRYNVEKIDNIRERRIRTTIIFIKRMLIMLIIVFSLALIMMGFQSVRKVGAGILTSAGIGALIVGFAAQKSLANILAGLQIAFTQPIRIDDVVVLEGEWGRIEEITLTYVVVRIWDQRRLILPINYFLEKPFQNWTRRSAELLGFVYIYADYYIDIDALRKELTKILQATPLWDGKVNILQVTDTTEKTIQLRALMSARNSGDAWDLRCIVREKLLEFIRNNYPDSLPKFRFDKPLDTGTSHSQGGTLNARTHNIPQDIT